MTQKEVLENLDAAHRHVVDAFNVVLARTGGAPIADPPPLDLSEKILPQSGTEPVDPGPQPQGFYHKMANPIFTRTEFGGAFRSNFLENAVPNWKAFLSDPFGQTHDYDQLVDGGFVGANGLPIAMPPGSDLLQLPELSYDWVYFTGLPTIVIRTDYDAELEIHGGAAHMTAPVTNGGVTTWEATLPDGFGGGGPLLLNMRNLVTAGTYIQVHYKTFNGAIVDPAANGGWFFPFLSEAGANTTLRMLDWHPVNQCDAISISDVATPAYAHYGAFKIRPSRNVKIGVPLAHMISLADAADTGLWFHMLGRLGQSAIHDDEANLNVFPADNLTYAQYLRNDAATIVASNEHELWVQAIYNAIHTAPAKVKAKTFYFEDTNENWNTLTVDFIPNTYIRMAIAEAVNPAWAVADNNEFIQTPYNRQGGGYMLARAQAEFDRLQALNGTSYDIRFVIANWTAVPASLTEFVEGFRYYCTQNAIDPVPRLARCVGIKAGYYSGAMSDFDISGNAQTAPLLEILGRTSFDNIEDDHRSGILSTDQICDSFNEFYTKDEVQFSNIAWSIQQGMALKSLADAEGIGTAYGPNYGMAGDYEARSHENINPNWNTYTASKAYIWQLYRHSPQHAAMVLEYARAHRDAFGDNYIVTSFSIGAATPADNQGPGGVPGANPWFYGSLHESDQQAPLRAAWRDLALQGTTLTPSAFVPA